uniref:Enoyl-[acyl-carrier-protein] reductase, mitochondrial n=1 Tax=Timema genevievae TaxID=629358 RepID=A0A7R9JT01_TIMGE|nr:unnamed protein product [Timema genevievae]
MAMRMNVEGNDKQKQTGTVVKDKDEREVEASRVLVRMLAAPLNPADINTIQGVYPAKPPLPAVPGNEGVGEILSVGSDVKNLHPGDHVIPKEASAWGTWRSHAVSDAQRLFKIPKEIGVVEAATMSVNPSTAYRMLKDFVQLSAGDTVIQNGANSAAGQNVIQLCKVWGLISVNIVRDRPNIDELKIFLKNLGATHILTEQELSKTDIFKSKAVSKAKLALNCVGGKSAVEILRQLDHKGVMVTYGGMSREPVTLPTSALIFKDISARGFWMSRWTKEHQGTQEQEIMQRDIAQLLIDGKLRAPVHKLLPLRLYQEAIKNTLNAKVTLKATMNSPIDPADLPLLVEIVTDNLEIQQLSQLASSRCKSCPARLNDSDFEHQNSQSWLGHKAQHHYNQEVPGTENLTCYVNLYDPVSNRLHRANLSGRSVVTVGIEMFHLCHCTILIKQSNETRVQMVQCDQDDIVGTLSVEDLVLEHHGHQIIELVHTRRVESHNGPVGKVFKQFTESLFVVYLLRFEQFSKKLLLVAVNGHNHDQPLDAAVCDGT